MVSSVYNVKADWSDISFGSRSGGVHIAVELTGFWDSWWLAVAHQHRNVLASRVGQLYVEDGGARAPTPTVLLLVHGLGPAVVAVEDLSGSPGVKPELTLFLLVSRAHPGRNGGAVRDHIDQFVELVNKTAGALSVARSDDLRDVITCLGAEGRGRPPVPMQA